MDRLRQKTSSPVRQDRSSRQEIAGFLGIFFLFLLPGCAQLDQLMGKQADAGAASPPAQTAEPAPAAPARENHPVQTTEPVSKPSSTKKADVSRPSGASMEPSNQAPSHKPAPQAAPASGAARQPESEIKKTESDKALAETDQSQKEKKSRATSDKKSKKSPKSQAESKPPADDVFLSPIPLPSKPAAIGGSGG